MVMVTWTDSLLPVAGLLLAQVEVLHHGGHPVHPYPGHHLHGEDGHGGHSSQTHPTININFTILIPRDCSWTAGIDRTVGLSAWSKEWLSACLPSLSSNKNQRHQPHPLLHPHFHPHHHPHHHQPHHPRHHPHHHPHHWHWPEYQPASSSLPKRDTLPLSRFAPEPPLNRQWSSWSSS